MEYRGWKVSLGALFLVCCATGLLLARSGGPPTARTGDFGEANCTACHTGNPVNADGGSFAISGVPQQYSPGQTYPITVAISRSGQSRWGFELAVRFASSGLQAGTLATTDTNTQIVSANGIQYIMHTLAGTAAGTSSGSWTFNWTAPAAAQGPIRFGAAGNAANNNGTNQGDYIYTTTATANAPAALPTTALFAQVAVGGGYSTVLTFVNTGDTPVTGTLILTGQDGAPLNVTLAEPAPGAEAVGSPPALASESPISIPAGGAQTLIASPSTEGDPTKVGWARVESNGGKLVGVANFQFAPGGQLQSTVGVLSAETVDSATIPVRDDAAANVFTGYALANPSSTDTVVVKVVMVDENGTISANLSPVTLGPGRQTARFFFQDPAASGTFKGTAVFIGQDGRKFSAVALVQDHGIFTAIPAAEGKAAHIN